MKRLLPLVALLALAAAFSACDSADNHGVNVQRGGFLSGLFGATTPAPAPLQAAPAAAPATPAPANS